jgi:tetratricopeptide (TPR) repeat protein
MNKKFDPVAYYKGFTLGYIMLAWIVVVFFMKQSEWWLIPLIFGYFILSAIIFRPYYYGMAGNMYYFIKRFDKADKYYRMAVAKNTTNVPALYNYAIGLLHEGKAKEALALFERAEKYNTKVIYAKNIPLAKGSCYWVLGEIDKAIETMSSLEKEYSYVNVSTLTTLGYLYILKGDYDKAEEYTLRATEDTPEHAPAWDNMGQIYYHKGDKEKAKEYFEKALGYKENMVDSLYYMGLIARDDGDIDTAVDYFKRALNCNVTALNTVTVKEIEAQMNELQNRKK